jgi:hypothetical protein
MSEFQNRAIELLCARLGEEAVFDKNERRNLFLLEALQLFRAMGGSADTVRSQATAVYSKVPGEVVVKIGDVMNSLAGVGLAHDVDMVQAAYNRLDDGWKSIGALPEKQAKRRF